MTPQPWGRCGERALHASEWAGPVKHINLYMFIICIIYIYIYIYRERERGRDIDIHMYI